MELRASKSHGRKHAVVGMRIRGHEVASSACSRTRPLKRHATQQLDATYRENTGWIGVLSMRRGFTIIEMLVAVLALVIIVAVVIITSPISNSKTPRHQLKDNTQQRGIGQAMYIWAGNNDDKYPLPSLLDVNDATVADAGRAKDTTANIFSILIDDGSITAEMCISPFEVNESIVAYDDYETEARTAAADPENALWDPGFTADFTAEGGGNFSYAHLIPVGERLDMWGITNNADEAILSNRGPEMASIERKGGDTITQFANPNTNTLLLMGSKNSWSGNTAFNDNHVEYNSNVYAHGEKANPMTTSRPLAGTKDHDVLFADEVGFPSNQYLGIFTSAGETKAEYTAIWD